MYDIIYELFVKMIEHEAMAYAIKCKYLSIGTIVKYKSDTTKMLYNIYNKHHFV